jgi:hypothetical protein
MSPMLVSLEAFFAFEFAVPLAAIRCIIAPAKDLAALICRLSCSLGSLPIGRAIEYKALKDTRMTLVGDFEILVQTLCDKSIEFYEDRLVSFVVFGSLGRQVMRTDSDMDFLLVVNPLPRGRLRRVKEFEAVEAAMKSPLAEARRKGIFTSLSPVLKTPAEAQLGSPLFWDMVEDSRILFDRDHFFKNELELLRRRLALLGARRIWKGNAWYWDLKPDYRYGDEFEL